MFDEHESIYLRYQSVRKINSLTERNAINTIVKATRKRFFTLKATNKSLYMYINSLLNSQKYVIL